MPLARVGTLPVSALNIGLVAGVGSLSGEIAKLQADISGLQLALRLQLELGINLPQITDLALGLSAQLLNLSQLLNPLTWVAIGFQVNADLLLQLGLVEAALAVQAAVVAQFQAGLNAPGLGLWTYSGPAAGFGVGLAAQTRGGALGAGPGAHMSALVLETESLDSWKAFGLTFNVGQTAARPATSTAANLRFEGIFAGLSINTGVFQLFARVQLFLNLLRGLAASLQAQIQVSLGLNLPPLPALVAGLNVDISVLFQNLITVKTDIGAAISGLQARIQILLDLIAFFQVSLSAGGLTLWVYDGPVSGFGASFQADTVGGLPDGSGPTTPAYGLALATVTPGAFAAFGQIFKVSA